MTMLHKAIKHGETENALTLIKDGADLKCLYKNKTPLEYAVRFGNGVIAQALINAGAAKRGLPDIHLAILLNDIEKLLHIIRECPTAINHLYHSMPPLHFAIRHDHPEIAQELINEGADLEVTYKKMTPLDYAIQSGKVKIAQALINAGATKGNFTAIHSAIFFDDLENVIRIINECPSAIEQLYDNMPPLHFAITHGRTDIAQMLIKQGANIEAIYEDMTPLHLAIVSENSQIVQVLILAGANLEAIYEGRTALYLAIALNYSEIALDLIVAGADREVVFKGRTALHCAVQLKQIEVVQKLIDAGANLEAMFDSMTPLHGAIDMQQTEIARVLINAGANIEALYQEMPPLLRAIGYQLTEIAQILITRGANPEAVYEDRTALHYAMGLKQTEIALALITAGANLDALFKDRTALHCAIELEQAEVAKALIAAGANLEAKFQNMTPLHYSLKFNQSEITLALIAAGANKAIANYMLRKVSDPMLIEALLPHCLIEDLPLGKLLPNQDYFNSDERRVEFIECKDPFDFLKSKNLLLPVTQAALELVRIAREVQEHESSSLLDAENAMDDSKVARANWHFEHKVKPHFNNAISDFVTVTNDKIALMTTLPESGPEQNTLYVGINEQSQLHYTRVNQNGEVIHDSLNQFLEEGKSLTLETLDELAGTIVDEVVKMEPILAIEKQIRALILDAIKKQAEEDNEQPIIAFINDNKDKLIQADPTTMQASCTIFNQTHSAQAAWRGYNPFAPVTSHEWKNLLTTPTSNEEVFSTSVAHQGQLLANSASEIARERAAYYYLAVTDPNDGNDSTRITRIENFISQLADIRNAHGLDNPSCYPGTLTRCAEMGAYHSVAQLPPTTKELIADFIKVKVLAVFQAEIEKLPSFAEKEALYNALVELTTLQAKDVILHPERYQPEWLALRQHFIALIGTEAEIVQHIMENNLFSMVEKDSIFVEQTLLDIAGGPTYSALASYFNRHTDSVPTIKDKQNANPFKDEDSTEHKLTRALLDAILQAVPQYATSMRKLHNLSGYLANKVPNLIIGAPVKNLLAGLEITDDKFDDVLQAVNTALENAGCKAIAKMANPFDAKFKQIELLTRNLPPAKAAPYQKQLDSIKNKQQRFNDYFPFVQQAFQEMSIQEECIVRLTEAFVSNLAISNEGFDQNAFCETLNEAESVFVQEHRKQLADLAMRLFEKFENPVEMGPSKGMRLA